MGQCASVPDNGVESRSVEKNLPAPLPSIPNRLPMVPEEWSTWGLDDLSLWARKAVRESHIDCPTAIAILYLSEADGSAAMHLVHEALGTGDSTDGADLKLKHGKPKFAELMKGMSSYCDEGCTHNIVYYLYHYTHLLSSIYISLFLSTIVMGTRNALLSGLAEPKKEVVQKEEKPRQQTEGADVSQFIDAIASMKKTLDSTKESLATELEKSAKNVADIDALLIEREELMKRVSELEAVLETQRADRENAIVRAVTAELAVKESSQKAQEELKSTRDACEKSLLEQGLLFENLKNDYKLALAREQLLLQSQTRERELLQSLAREREQLQAQLLQQRIELESKIDEQKEQMEVAEKSQTSCMAEVQQRCDSLNISLTSMTEGYKRADAELLILRSKNAEMETKHPLALESLRTENSLKLREISVANESKVNELMAANEAKVSGLIAAHATELFQKVKAEREGKEETERKLVMLQLDFDSNLKLVTDLKSKVMALESVNRESMAYSDKIVKESTEHIAAIRADCDSKIQLIHREAGKEVEQAVAALETTTSNAMRSVAEAQHALQDFKDNFAKEVEKNRLEFEVKKAEAVAKMREENLKDLAEAQRLAHVHMDEMEEDHRKRFAAKEDELMRMRDNLENVSKAFRSECEKVTAMEQELHEMQSKHRASLRKQVFSSTTTKVSTGEVDDATASVPVPTSASPATPGKIKDSVLKAFSMSKQ